MNSISKLSRRRVLRGMMGGAAVTVGLPFLDCFLDSNGRALAATRAPLPVCFGTWFYGCGLNPGRWEPAAVGRNYEFGVELQPLAPFKHKLNVYTKARLANQFKWALIEAGYPKDFVDRMTFELAGVVSAAESGPA